jgi:hypothetical protein
MVDTSVELNPGERKVLDAVAEHQLFRAEPLSVGALVLEFPPERAAAVEETATALVRRGLLVSSGSPNDLGLSLSATGLLNSSLNGPSAALAERLLTYIQERLSSEKGQFRSYTWKNLLRAHVVGSDGEFGQTLAVVSIFELGELQSRSFGPPPTAMWNLPPDAPALREIHDIVGLHRRVARVPQEATTQRGPIPQEKPSPVSFEDRPYLPWIRGRKLGSGGQGEAYLARHAETGESGVLKLIYPDPNGDLEVRKKARARFEHELKSIRAIDHPCVLRVLDADAAGEEPWIVTEFIALGSLESALTALRGDAWRTLRLARDVASGLAAAHAGEIIHRDVKPRNILLRTLDHAVLGDFGIAHISDATELTSTGEKVAARWFGPPEADNGRLDEPEPSFDVYSLGKVIYVCLSGGSRFSRERFRDDGADLVEILSRPDLESVNRLLDGMIVEKPSERLQSMEDVIRRIDETLGELFGHGPGDQCRVCCAFRPTRTHKPGIADTVPGREDGA